MRLDPRLQREITRSVLDEHCRVEPLGRNMYQCECGVVVRINTLFTTVNSYAPYWYEHVRYEIENALELARKELSILAG